MVSFVALYRGESLPRAELVAVGTDPELISLVAATLLKAKLEEGKDDPDPALTAISAGRRRALRLVRREAEERLSPEAPATR